MAKQLKKPETGLDSSAGPKFFGAGSVGFWPPFLLAVVAFLAYLPSLQSDFVYDARLEILQEGFVTSLANLPAILSLKVLGSYLMGGFRPGEQLYLMLNAAVWGKEPFGFHLGSNLLHAANVALLFVLLRRFVATELTAKPRNEARKVLVALMAVTLLFALHPLAVESVAEVSYSSCLLVTFFTLLALIAATAFRPEDLREAGIIGSLGTLAVFAAVTCKESGLTAVLLLIAYRILFRRHEANGPWLLFLGASMAVTAAFLAARFLLAPPGRDTYTYLGGSFSQVFLIQPRLWVFMMGKLVWPTQLSADYTLENANGISTPLALVTLTVVVLLQGWLATRSRIGAMGVAFYWLGLVTVSNFVPLYRIVADRFYYLPLAGVSMQLLALLLLVLEHPRGFWTAVGLLFASTLPLTLLTLERQKVFKDESSLWSDTLRVSPFSWTARDNLGVAFLQKGEVDEAITQYQQALDVNPTYDKARNNLGFALLQKGAVDPAVAQFQKALAINPNYAEAHNNLGNALMQKGQGDEALSEYQKALALNPNYADAHYNLGQALWQMKRTDEATTEFRRTLEINPDHADAHNSLGIALAQKGEMDEAIVEYQAALEIDPNHYTACYNLGNALWLKGRRDEALAQLQKAVEINSNFAEGYNNLGNLLLQMGQTDEAVLQWQKALALKPAFLGAHYNLGKALLQQGKIEEAVAQFEETLRLKPDFTEAQSSLARALVAQKAASLKK